MAAELEMPSAMNQAPEEGPVGRWGMVIDLDKCTGCRACETACAMENNVPVVSDAELAMGRGITWMKVLTQVSGLGLWTPETQRVALLALLNKQSAYYQATMVKADEGSSWIDTPGVREFGLAGVALDDLAKHFSEFSALECSSRGCKHLDEDDGCNARELWRYSSFRRIYESIRAGEN